MPKPPRAAIWLVHQDKYDPDNTIASLSFYTLGEAREWLQKQMLSIDEYEASGRVEPWQITGGRWRPDD
jgi:hypothetical protein